MENLVIDYLSEDFVNNILYKSMVNEMVMFHDDQKIAKQSEIKSQLTKNSSAQEYEKMLLKANAELQ